MISHLCPCGSAKTYQECCGVYIEEGQPAATPEALMRSRYTAFATHHIDYIANTMKEVAAHAFDKAEALEWSKKVKWLGLSIISATTENEQGFVEFIANYQVDGKKCSMHELSKFNKIGEIWYYVDGKMLGDQRNTAAKVGRNECCPCGSGKKYKKCCVK